MSISIQAIDNKKSSKVELQRHSANTSGNARVGSAPARNGNATTVEFGKSLEVKRTAPVQDRSTISEESGNLMSVDHLHTMLSDMLGPKAAQAPQSQNEYKKPSDDSLLDEGFNRDKLTNPDKYAPHDGRSVKYNFARVAMSYSLDKVKGSKDGVESLLNAMTGDLKAAGVEVLGVSGDRIQVKTEAGYEWVDVIKDCGGDNPKFTWGSEGKGTAQPTKNVQDWAAQTGVDLYGNAAGAAAGAAAAAGGAAAAAAGPKFTPLGDSLDRSGVMAILEKYQPNNDGIKKAMGELTQKFPGVKLLDHPKRLDKLQFPNGAVVDVIVGAGGPDSKWGWMPEN